jgi:hypothetical protein
VSAGFVNAMNKTCENGFLIVSEFIDLNESATKIRHLDLIR